MNPSREAVVPDGLLDRGLMVVRQMHIPGEEDFPPCPGAMSPNLHISCPWLHGHEKVQLRLCGIWSTYILRDPLKEQQQKEITNTI